MVRFIHRSTKTKNSAFIYIYQQILKRDAFNENTFNQLTNNNIEQSKKYHITKYGHLYSKSSKLKTKEDLYKNNNNPKRIVIKNYIIKLPCIRSVIALNIKNMNI